MSLAVHTIPEVDAQILEIDDWWRKNRARSMIVRGQFSWRDQLVCDEVIEHRLGVD